MTHMRPILFLGILVACNFKPPDVNPSDPDGEDPTPDASVVDGSPMEDARPACAWTQDPAHFDPCKIPDPVGALVLDMAGTYIYDTTAGTLERPDSTLVDHAAEPLANDIQESWLASVDRLEIQDGVTLRVVGDRPLVIASKGDILVAATALIDASSKRNGLRGAGSNRMPCNAQAAVRGPNDSGGGAGSGGGGFAGSGGKGGDSDSDGGISIGGAGGMGLAQTPAFVRGGCDGAEGGDGNLPNSGGTGGKGGGAVQLSAQVEVRVLGTIHAGGGGGNGGNEDRDAGGGGGGSGGYIGLDAPTIILDGATLAANGGGGGEGSNATERGNPGADSTADDQPAGGGAGRAGSGSDGGSGSAGTTLDGTSVPPPALQGAGGGGGGGAGFILVSTAPQTPNASTLSPPLTGP